MIVKYIYIFPLSSRRVRSPFSVGILKGMMKGSEKMKAIGMARKVDELGRIVIPIETRRKMGINRGDMVEFLVDGDSVVVKKYLPTCTFCNETGNLKKYKGKDLCRRCLDEIRRY